MLISHKNKFVFVAINKTGTTSIHDALECVSEIKSVGDSQSPFYFHATAKKIKSKFKKNNWDWDSYFKFSFVRNPWDRMVSAYFYRLKMVKRWNITKPKDKHTQDVYESFQVQLHSTNNFNEWLKKYIKHESVAFHQHKFLYDNDEKIVDFVGKFENLNNDFNHAMNKIKCGHIKLPFLNRSSRKSYKEYYTEETRNMIKNYYKKDIKLFNYYYDN
jgi:hypothetical protein